MEGKKEHEHRVVKKNKKPQVVDTREILPKDEYERRIKKLKTSVLIRDFRRRFARGK